MAIAVGECIQEARDDVHKLIAGALAHLVQGEHEGDMCTVFVPFLLSSTHSLLFMERPRLNVLRSCCKVSSNFARAVLLKIAGLLQSPSWQELCNLLSQKEPVSPSPDSCCYP